MIVFISNLRIMGLMMSFVSMAIFISCNGVIIVPDGDVNPERDLETLAYIDKSCSSCDFVVESSAWKFDGIEHNVQPGDTIGIPSGGRDGLLIINIEGTKENPIVIINCDGRAVLGTNKDAGKGIEVKRSKHFQIAGIGSTDSQYGI